MTDFRPQPLTDRTIHCDLAGACAEAGIIAEHGYCDAVVINDSGRARVRKDHILRFRSGEMLMDIMDGDGDSFHCIRFLAVCPKTSAIKKMKVFSQMVSVLHRTGPKVSGTPATENDNSVKMAQGGSWRFIEQKSPWGFNISRLEQFWLRVGGITTRLFDDSKNRMVFLREDEAIKFMEKFRRDFPDVPSPFYYASRHGIYSTGTLLKLKEASA
ncbi:MAG: hypothetical protein WCL71_02745 [Deltaproteobacteria bacterium]